jgi:hypothetical protein
MEKIPNDSAFLFWQQWLFYTSIMFAFAGIAFAIFGNSFPFQAYNTMLAKLFWHRSHFPTEADEFRTFIYAPFGGTIACCYILLAFIARYPFKDKQAWARNAIIIAFGVWILIDSSVCFYFGVYPQIYLINAFSILVKALPIIFTWKHFSS